MESTKGNFNTAIGIHALFNNTTGSYNTAVGGYASPFGPFADGTISNWIGIGYNCGGGTSKNNRVEIGNTSVEWIGGQVGWGTYSDGRIKTNIQENVPGLAFINLLRPVTYHLDIHKQNEMIGKAGKNEADWKGKYDIEKKTMTGFIAQDVEAAAKKINYDFSGIEKPQHTEELYTLRYSDFVIPLVKAVQEQQAIIEEQNKKIELLLKEIQTIKEKLK